tara:strand:+ start:78 stop:734 length:657 start_codon:yes stop_codon:yes gene_type:complete
MRILTLLLLATAWQASIANIVGGAICRVPASCSLDQPQRPEPSDIASRLGAIAIIGSGSINLDIAQTLYLDREIYDSHVAQISALTSDSEIHFGPFPADFELPIYTDYSLYGAVGSDSTSTISISSDAALLWAANFDGNVQIHAVGDIYVTDTTQFREAIFPTPIPAPWVLLLSALVIFKTKTFFALKSNKVLQLTRYSALFQRADIFTFPKRAVTSS